MDTNDFIEMISAGGKTYRIYGIRGLEKNGLAEIDRLPFSIRILVENLMRKLDGRIVTEENLLNIARWRTSYEVPVEVPYHPARVLMQDFTGVPAVVDLAAMRDAVAGMGGDPKSVNPFVPVELIVDHSVQVDYYGTRDAAHLNVKKEYERNGERYALLKWAQRNFDNFKVVPPRSGICHQVNLENLGRVVMTEGDEEGAVAFPDTLVGLDSHTTMINGLGVMGWGVGGIEAEAVMLGQSYNMSIPEVIGFRMTGRLRPGVTATDLVLTITEILREYKVVEKFVEFFGSGIKNLTLPDRATISNMTPEFGATLGFFPVDEQTVEYLRLTDRGPRAELVETYCRANDMFYSGDESPEYTDVLELDLSTVEPCVAGPARPQDRITVTNLKERFSEIKDQEEPEKKEGILIELNGAPVRLFSGAVVIAAITSCTNTSNPSVLLGAGLMAKNAVELGLKVPPYVKTSFAPGSMVVPRYLENAGLLPYLEALGFHLVGYGCTTCIGNSGPIHPAIEKAIEEKNLQVAAVLSGNRNFEARIHQKIPANFLASPMLVMAYALAGRMDIDLTREPIGRDPNGTPVHLEQIWPEDREIQELVKRHVRAEFFEEEYSRFYDGDDFWRALPDVESITYTWDPESTYIKHPPYFEDFSRTPVLPTDVDGARALVVVGDSITTDHISPAGAIPKDYPAGRRLIDLGVSPEDFNSYGSRRGNHEVMMRGTFGNIRLKNLLASGKEGGFTRKFPQDQIMPIFDAAMAYKTEGTSLIVLGGREYGTGSSRDWAAKGSFLLGVKAVIARSFERIHRSNLVGMGVLPLQFLEDQDIESLGLDGTESYYLFGIDRIRPREEISVRAVREDGSELTFPVVVALNTMVELDYYRHGGILPYVLRKMLSDQV